MADDGSREADGATASETPWIRKSPPAANPDPP